MTREERKALFDAQRREFMMNFINAGVDQETTVGILMELFTFAPQYLDDPAAMQEMIQERLTIDQWIAIKDKL